VLIETEDPSIIKANPFKNPVAVEQTVIEHGNLRVLFVVKLTVYVDFHVEKWPGNPAPR
jgi:hypothetical protein